MWLVLLASALAAGKVDEVASLLWLWGWVMRGSRCWSLVGASVSSGSCFLAPRGLLPCEILGWLHCGLLRCFWQLCAQGRVLRF